MRGEHDSKRRTAIYTRYRQQSQRTGVAAREQVGDRDHASRCRKSVALQLLAVLVSLRHLTTGKARTAKIAVYNGGQGVEHSLC